MIRTIIRIPISLVVLFSIACSSQRQNPIQTVRVNNDSIRYTGRVKYTADSICVYWPGTAIEFRFRGKNASATMHDQHGENYFNVIIDGDSLHYIKLDSLKHNYTLAENLPDGEHTIQLIKRTEWDQGNTWFYGLQIHNGKFLSLSEPNKRVIEFFGNSITAGYAIEDTSGKDSPKGLNTNSYYTYAALTARHFNADYYCTVKSGIGVLVSWFPLIMPEMYNRLDPADSTSRWDFKKITPDVVVINLFQNDCWLVKMPDHPSFKMRFGPTPPTEKVIIESYRAFVEKIRLVYPKAYIICALGSMDAVKEGSPWPGYVQAAVKKLNDDKILTHFFAYKKTNGHPNLKENQAMAESLISFIDKNVKW
jgi:hypothetical protein